VREILQIQKPSSSGSDSGSREQSDASQDQQVVVRGVVGGYLDTLHGSAVLTIPIRASSGSGPQIIARVEAEADWVRTTAEEVRPIERRAAPVRWLLRHMELEVEGSPPEILYSLPAHRPQSPWAPGHGPFLIPRPLRAAVPEMSGLLKDPGAMQALVLSGALMLMNALGYIYVRGHGRRRKEFEMMCTKMSIPLSRRIVMLREQAAKMVNKAAAERNASRGRISLSSKSLLVKNIADDLPIYGSVTPELTRAFSMVNTNGGLQALVIEIIGNADDRGEGRLSKAALISPNEILEAFMTAQPKLRTHEILLMLLLKEDTTVSQPDAPVMQTRVKKPVRPGFQPPKKG